MEYFSVDAAAQSDHDILHKSRIDCSDLDWIRYKQRGIQKNHLKRLLANNICDNVLSYPAMLLYFIRFLGLIALFNDPNMVKNLVRAQ